jgi:hypothetical protein
MRDRFQAGTRDSHKVQIGAGPTLPPIQQVNGTLSMGVKHSGREADYSPPSAEVTNTCSYTSSPPYVFTAFCLMKHGKSFTFFSSIIPDIWFGRKRLNSQQIFLMNRDSSVCIATGLLVGRPGNQGSILSSDKFFSSPQRPDRLRGPPSHIGTEASGEWNWPLTSIQYRG